MKMDLRSLRFLSLAILVLAGPGGWTPIAAQETSDPDTVVVCPAEFYEALRPWTQWRTGQGHRLTFLSNRQSAQQIRTQIAQLSGAERLKTVVLVGDVIAEAEATDEQRRLGVPTFYLPAKVNIHWGSPPEIASDNPYADIDGDGRPELTVGRLSARTPEQLAVLVRKILDYETSGDMGPWRRKVHFVAGVGGFGPLADGMIQSVAKRFITEGIPPAYQTTMTYGSQNSPYCPDPRDFRNVTLQRLNEGSLFWVYIGHGSPTHLDRLRMAPYEFPIFESGDAGHLACRTCPPIAVFLACYTAAFDGRDDCLAEQMLRNPGGPVAVIGSSRVAMPYGMAVQADGMLQAVFEQHVPTLGEVILRAKRSSVASADEKPSVNRRMLDSLVAVMGPKENNPAEERAEHLLLFNLLGDPLLTLRYPQMVSLEPLKDSVAGDTVRVTGTSPLEGTCVVELVCRRDRLRFSPPARAGIDWTDQALAAWNRVYQQANDSVWMFKQLQVAPGRFELPLEIPAEALGRCHVRVFIQGREQFALGATDLYIKRPAPPAAETAPKPLAVQPTAGS